MFRLIKKNQKGFTLVEVIVVAVIVAVLAAVAIPLYLNYVTTSRENVVNNAAGSLASFCGAAKNSGQDVVAVGPVAAGTVIKSADGNTQWIVPLELTAKVEAGQVIVAHTKGALYSKTVPY